MFEFFKNRKEFTIVSLLLLTLVTLVYADATWTTNAQKTWNEYDEIITFDNDTIPDDSTRTSSIFNLDKYNGVNWTSFPFQVQFDVDVSPAPTVLTKATAILWGSIDGSNWHFVDTLTIRTGQAVADTTANFNNGKWPKYRITVKNNHGADTTLSWQYKVFLYQNSPN